jgi:hypothetical protein
LCACIVCPCVEVHKKGDKRLFLQVKWHLKSLISDSVRRKGKERIWWDHLDPIDLQQNEFACNHIFSPKTKNQQQPTTKCSNINGDYAETPHRLMVMLQSWSYRTVASCCLDSEY